MRSCTLVRHYQFDARRAVTALLALLDYVRDRDLDPDQRARLREYTTPRRGLDGERVWLADELASEREDDDE